MKRPRLELTATVLDSPDARALAAFYEELLGWEIGSDEPDWVVLRSPDGDKRLSFQTESEYIRPVWPSNTADQQMMSHLDIATEDLAEAVEWARAAGATVAEWQPQDDVRVMLDPAGHPFCLFEWSGFGSEVE